ncbi:MAG TPA: hypothetical protein VGN57_12735 [Pirellulaceae bacterium]|jgi:hypothetical protein|nr:hypothetical protein [Pirellulaceae bacterium]
MADSSQIVTFWLYLGDAPLMAVRLPADATNEQVKEKAYAELDACPGVVCDGLEAPFERRHKIGQSRVVRPTEPTRYHAYYTWTPDNRNMNQERKNAYFSTDATTPVEIARAAYAAVGETFTDFDVEEIIDRIIESEIEEGNFDFTIDGGSGPRRFEIENVEDEFEAKLQRLERMEDASLLHEAALEILKSDLWTWEEKKRAWAALGHAVGATDELTPESLAEHLEFTGNAPKVEEPVVEGGRAIAFIGGRIIAPRGVEARPANAVFVISSISRQQIADALSSCLEDCRREGATVMAEEGATVTPSMLSDDFCRRYAECLANLTGEEEDAFLDLQVSGLAELGLVKREPVEG